MKKLFALILCVLLVGALAVTASAAGTQIKVTPATAAVYPGEEVTLTVVVSGSENWTSMGYIPLFDSTAFEVVDGKVLPGFTGPLSDFDTVNGGAVMVDPVASGNVFEFTIKIKEDAAAGKYPVTDEANMSIKDFEVIDAEITVLCKHDYSAWTEAGDEHTQTCGKCGDVQKAAHAWKEEVVKEATCKEEGELKKTCTVCSATKTEAIEKTTDHVSDKWEKVDEKGHKGTCSVCAQEVTVDHVFEAKVTKEATCKEEGVKTLTCACGETKTEAIAKLTKHTSDEGKITTAATADKEGVKTYTCTVCGEVLKTEAVAKVKGDSTKVGDSTLVAPLMILVVLSGFGLALTVIGKKKFAR